jgi:hypothetical protein
MDLYLEIQDKVKALDEAIEELESLAYRKAKSNQEYKVVKAQVSFTLKAQGYPVSLIADICYRDEELSDSLHEKDLAESLYEVCQEKINALKLNIRLLENQLAREYGR